MFGLKYWVALLFATVLAAPQPGSNRLRKEIDPLVGPLVSTSGEEGKAFGLLVGVAGDGARQFFSFGTRRRRFDEPPTAKDVWEIGSLSKVATALLAAKLAPARFDDRVSGAFPELATLDSVPVIDLLTHFSGLPRRLPDFRSDSSDRASFFRSLRSAPHLPPGRAYEYSNPGYGLLGLCLAKWEGRSYDELLAAHVARPLGLSGVARSPGGRWAHGYAFYGGRMHGVPPLMLGDPMEGAGGLRASGESLLALAEALRTGAPGSGLEAAIARMKEPRREVPCTEPEQGGTGCRIALGLYVDSHGRYWKDGITNGFDSYLIFTKRHSVILLANARVTKGLGATAAAILKLLGE